MPKRDINGVLKKYETRKDVTFGTKVTPDFYSAFREAAKGEDLTISQAIRVACWEWLTGEAVPE